MASSMDCGASVSAKNRIQIAELLAEVWNSLGLRYAIVHGVENHPKAIGRDLDILVHHGDSAKMLASARGLLSKEGWTAIEPPDTWGERIVAFADSEGLELHTMTQLAWREIPLAATPRVVDGGLFPRDPWASYCKQVLMPAFHGDLNKTVSNAASLALSGVDRERVRQELAAFVSDDQESLVEQVLDATPEILGHLLPSLRSAMVRRAWRQNPVCALKTLRKKIVQRIIGLVRPTGVTVRLVTGVDIDPEELKRRISSTSKSVFTDFVFRIPKPTRRASELDPLFEVMKRAWLRMGRDRFSLSGQRVVIHVSGPASSGEATGVIGRIANWVDNLGPQPQAVLAIGNEVVLEPERGWIDIGSMGPEVGDAVVRHAIAAFIRAHTKTA